MRFAWLLVGGCGLVWAIGACSSDNDLFRPDGSPPPGTGASGAGTTATGTAGSGTTTTVTTSTGAGTATATTTTGTGAGTTTTTTTTTTTPPPPPEIPCGNQTCLGPEVCCISYQGAQYDECGPPGSCSDTSVEAACDGPDDCPGAQICCGRFVENPGYYTEVACVPTCESVPGTLGVTMCESAADCTGADCVASGWLPDGFSYCDSL